MIVMLSTPEIAGLLMLVIIGGSGLVAWRLRRHGKGPTGRKFVLQWLILLAIIGFTAANAVPAPALLVVLLLYALVGVPLAVWMFSRTRPT